MNRGIILILGGARSGKTAWALREAERRLVELSGTEHPGIGSHALYVATAQPLDAEMEERIQRHKEERSELWRTVEEPLDLSRCLLNSCRYPVVLVDCLTMWVSNLMACELSLDQVFYELCTALKRVPNQIILVSNEVGLGIVPDNPVARRFRDAAGRLHQDIAAISDEIFFVAAGIAMRMK
ncbi:MAG: bifunctional adenosylcobinamide kinase/adenosylcobinamide-phosphate guanylyltransferase [Dissulfuribacterales bacterium]